MEKKLLLLAIMIGTLVLPGVIALGENPFDGSTVGTNLYLTNSFSTDEDGVFAKCSTFVERSIVPVMDTCYGRTVEFKCYDDKQQECEAVIVEKEHECQVDVEVFETKHTVCKDENGNFLRELN